MKTGLVLEAGAMARHLYGRRAGCISGADIKVDGVIGVPQVRFMDALMYPDSTGAAFVII